MPVTLHVPAEPTVVVTGAVVFVPSVATTEIDAPTGPVPLADVSVSFVALIGLVTDATATVILLMV